jgi:hypothetical protein
MSDNEVIVTIEPELFDFEITRRAIAIVCKNKEVPLAPVAKGNACCHD